MPGLMGGRTGIVDDLGDEGRHDLSHRSVVLAALVQDILHDFVELVHF